MNGSCSTYERGMCRIWVSRVPHMGKLCPIYGWVVSHIWVSRVPHMGESCPTHGWVVSHIWVSCVPRMGESCPPYSLVISHNMSYFRLIVSRVWVRDTSVHNTTHTRDIGWRRPVECLKLQDIFRKRTTYYWALLRKMTYKDEASYDSTPPCMTHLLVRVCGTWLFHGESCLVYRLWGGYD